MIRDYIISWSRAGKTVLALLCAATALTVVIATPLHAQWRDKVKSINLGIIAGERPAVTIRNIEPFRQALADELKIDVTIFMAKNYASMIRAQISKRINYGIYSASAFSSLWVDCKCAEPIAATRMDDSAGEIYSILVVDQNRISDLGDIASKKIAYSIKRSLTGYILPRRELQNTDSELGAAAGNSLKLVGAGSGENALALLLDGEVDGMFGWSTLKGEFAKGYTAGTLNQLVRKNTRAVEDFKVLWQSGPIPGGPHVVSTDFPQQGKDLILNFLTGLYTNNPAAYDAVENFKSGGFAKAGIPDYQYLIELLGGKKSGLVPPSGDDDTKTE